MGFKVSDIDHIPEFSDYRVMGEKISDCIIPFKKPDPSPWIEKNIYFHFDDTMCSLCGIVTEKALAPSFSNLTFMFKVIFAGGLSGRRDLIVGKYDSIPEGAENIVCIGTCVHNLAKKHTLPFIKGCPPTVEDVKEQYYAFCRSTKRLKPK